MIGLDIGSYSIKAVELQGNDSALTLKGFKIKDRVPQEPLQDTVRKLFEEGQFGSKALAISVSGHLVLTRMLELPEMKDEELKNAIKFEIERFIPFSIEDAVLDYQIILRNQKAKKVTILLAVAKKSFIINYLDMISQLGFTVSAIDVDGLALTNAFLNAYPEKKDVTYDKAFGILHIGDANLNVSVVYQGIPYVLRDIGCSGAELSEVISKSLGISQEEAYKLKCNIPDQRREELFDIMRPTLSRFARDIRLSIGYFENQFSKGVELVYLSGGSSKIVGLSEYLTECLDIPIESWDPFSPIAIGDNISVKSLEEAKRELAVAVGLAIKDD